MGEAGSPLAPEPIAVPVELGGSGDKTQKRRYRGMSLQFRSGGGGMHTLGQLGSHPALRYRRAEGKPPTARKGRGPGPDPKTGPAECRTWTTKAYLTATAQSRPRRGWKLMVQLLTGMNVVGLSIAAPRRREWRSEAGRWVSQAEYYQMTCELLAREDGCSVIWHALLTAWTPSCVVSSQRVHWRGLDGSLAAAPTCRRGRKLIGEPSRKRWLVAGWRPFATFTHREDSLKCFPLQKASSAPIR